MRRQTILIHAGWGVAVLVAFLVGSQRHPAVGAGSSAGGDPATPGAPGRGDSAWRSSASSSPSRERGARRSESLPEGLLAKLFASRAASRGDMLALAEEAARDPNPITRRLAFTRLLESLTPENALAVRNQLAALGSARANGAISTTVGERSLARKHSSSQSTARNATWRRP
jgi:hypothetical protein